MYAIRLTTVHGTVRCIVLGSASTVDHGQETGESVSKVMLKECVDLSNRGHLGLMKWWV